MGDGLISGLQTRSPTEPGEEQVAALQRLEYYFSLDWERLGAADGDRMVIGRRGSLQ